MNCQVCSRKELAAEPRYKTKSGGVLCTCQHCGSNEAVHPPDSKCPNTGHATDRVDRVRVAHDADAVGCFLGGRCVASHNPSYYCATCRYACSSPNCPEVESKIKEWETNPENPMVKEWTSELVLKHKLMASFSTWTAEYFDTLPKSVQEKYRVSVYPKGAVMPTLAEQILNTDETWSDFSRVVDSAYSHRCDQCGYLCDSIDCTITRPLCVDPLIDYTCGLINALIAGMRQSTLQSTTGSSTHNARRTHNSQRSHLLGPDRGASASAKQ